MRGREGKLEIKIDLKMIKKKTNPTKESNLIILYKERTKQSPILNI